MQFRHIVIAVTLTVLAALVWFASNAITSASVGAAAVAKVACSCVFVDRRDLSDCRKEDPPGVEGIAVSIDKTTRTATGSVLGMIHRSASYAADYGCTLDP